MSVFILLGILALVYALGLYAVIWVSIHPLRIPMFHSPGHMGVPQETVSFESSDGIRLSGWWCACPESRGVVVLSHGYMMNRAECAASAHWFYQQGFSSLLYDFRAFGRSGGNTCSLGWKERLDVLAAVDFALEKSGEEKAILWGSSMGAAASALAAGEAPEKVSAVILDSAYSNVMQAMEGWWKFVLGKASWILHPTIWLAPLILGKDSVQSDVQAALNRYGRRPVLILHGTADILAVPAQAERNHEASPQSTLVWFEGAQHSEARWIDPAKYEQSMKDFLDLHGLLRERNPS